MSAQNDGETAFGKHNVSIKNVSAFSVGVGEFGQAKNGFLITEDGKIYIPGIGGYTGVETDLTGISDLATVIANL